MAFGKKVAEAALVMANVKGYETVAMIQGILLYYYKAKQNTSKLA